MTLVRPLATEKAMRLMEAENTIVFLVERSARKPAIRQAVERMFEVKVRRINTALDSQGRKRAYIKLAPESPAIDLATKLGLM